MARLMPAVGTVSYNGFTFPTPFEAEVVALPRRDSSGRVIKYITYTITIKAVIAPDDAPKSTPGGLVDNNLENIRCKLQKSGGAFKFIGQGFGTDFVVNDNTVYSDPDSASSVQSHKVDPTFGPHPTILAWKPIGSNRACQIVWSVEVTIPDCCQAETALTNILTEFNYTVSYDISDEGVTTRIIQGRYEAFGMRAAATSGITGGGGSGSRILYTADTFWDRVYGSFLIPLGFRREARHSLSADKRVCDFVITDTEIPSDNPYFPYMVKMNVRQRTSMSATGLVAGKINNSLSGSITVAPTAPRHMAWLAFSKITEQRVFASKGLVYSSKGQGTAKVQHTAYPIPIHVSIDENLYGRDVMFQYDWFYIGDLPTIFRGSGLFKPVNATTGTVQSWTQWTLSMTQMAYSSRALAGLTHVPADDLIITACDPQPALTKNANAVKYAAENPFTTSNDYPYPPQNSSYMDYQMTIVPSQSTNTVKHRKIKKVSENTPNPKSGGTALGVGLRIDTSTNDNPSEVNDTVQVRGASSFTVALMGSAMRWGYSIPIPTVSRIGNQTPIVLDVQSAEKIVGKALNIPIYASAWMILLDFTGLPVGDLMTNLTTTNALPEQNV
jgi:hypothetical protein